MYVRSIVYEPFHGGLHDGIMMLHVRLVREGQLYYEPIDLYNEVLKASSHVGNTENVIHLTIDSDVEYHQEVMDFIGTMRDNGVSVIAEIGAYSRPAWISMVDYLIAVCSDEKPLPFAANEIRYIPQDGQPKDGVYGHQNAVHILDLREKIAPKVVFDFLKRNPNYKVLIPKLRLYQIQYVMEDIHEETQVSDGRYSGPFIDWRSGGAS